MEAPIERFLAMHGVTYKIYRDNSLICEVDGLTNKGSITFQIGTDVEKGDVLVNPNNERFYVIDKQTIYTHKNATHITVSISTEAEHKVVGAPNNPVFNIGNVSNSIIGSQNNATMYNGATIADLKELIYKHNSVDKEQLESMIDLLEKELSGNRPIKKGLLSKFVTVLQNNGWIVSPLASFILEHFFLH